MFNNLKKIIFLFILINILTADITTAYKVRKANRKIHRGNYQSAREIYNNLPKDNFKTIFNKGYLEAASQNFQESQNYYQLIAASKKYPAKVKAKTLFNLANDLLRQNKIKEAIKNYRQALLLDPGNKKIIQNLEIANNLKPAQQAEQQKDQNSDDKNNQEDSNKKENNNQGDNQNKNSENNTEKNEEKKNAERILDAFKDDELKALKTIINKQELDYDVEQDW